MFKKLFIICHYCFFFDATGNNQKNGLDYALDWKINIL